MRAKYAGTCTRTGTRYAAGTEIVKGARGWEIAGASASSRSTTAAPDYQTVRTNKGEIKEHVNTSVPFYCGECLEADGLLEAARNGTIDLAPYTKPRAGNDWTCPRCGGTTHLMSDDEIWNEVTLPNLHFVGNTLNRKVGPAMWDKIARFFEYISYADLAEAAEDNDDFDEAYEYESLGRGGEWMLRDIRTLETVEEILGILPQNRRAVLDPAEKAAKAQAAAETQEVRRIAQEREETKERLFNRADGEYVPRSESFDGILRGISIDWQGGHNIYGGGTEFLVETAGAYVWLVRNNGMDGDDWSRNNIATGGAGAIGLRFPFTAERRAFLSTLTHQTLPEPTEPTPTDPAAVEAELDQAAQAAYADDAAKIGAVEAARVWLVLCRNADTYDSLQREPRFARARRLVGLLGIQTLVQAASAQEWIIRGHDDSYAYRGDKLATARLHDLPHVLLTRAKDGYMDARPRALCQIFNTSCSPSIWLHPDGRTFAGVSRPGEGGFGELVDISHLTEADYAAALDIRESQADADKKARAIQIIQNAAARQAKRQGMPLLDLPAIVSLNNRKSLDQREMGGRGGGTNAELERVEATLAGGAVQTLYLVSHGWWAMGEDGDAGEDVTIYTNEADARRAFAERPFGS